MVSTKIRFFSGSKTKEKRAATARTFIMGLVLLFSAYTAMVFVTSLDLKFYILAGFMILAYIQVMHFNINRPL